MKTLTTSQMLAYEATANANARFTINFARCQYGNRIGRVIATLISKGHTVTVVLSFGDSRDGFVIDGSFVVWSEVGK